MPGAVLCFALIVRVDEPDPDVNDMVLELRLSVGGLVPEETADRDTVPVNPLTLATLIVTVPVLPMARLSALVFVERLKS